MTGIKKENVKKYWDNRSSQQGKNTVGFGNKPLTEQDKNYQIRYSFILPYLDTTLKTIDFGCGVGRYSGFFEPDKYLGVDITKNLLDIAVHENSKHDYNLLSEPNLTGINYDYEQFFVATVLQHNDDDGVRDILRTINSDFLKRIVLYENTSDIPNREGRHIKFRSVKEYIEFMKEFFNVKTFDFDEHVIHGEKHSVIQIILK